MKARSDSSAKRIPPAPAYSAVKGRLTVGREDMETMTGLNQLNRGCSYFLVVTTDVVE